MSKTNHHQEIDVKFRGCKDVRYVSIHSGKPIRQWKIHERLIFSMAKCLFARVYAIMLYFFSTGSI